MINPILKIRNLWKEEELILLHHKFMRLYGWISIEEFKNIPVPTMHGLMYAIKKEETESNKKKR